MTRTRDRNQALLFSSTCATLSYKVPQHTLFYKNDEMGLCIREHILSRIGHNTNDLFNSYSVGLYKCKGDTKCIARDKVCDGKVHCNKNKDDEKYCHEIGKRLSLSRSVTVTACVNAWKDFVDLYLYHSH